MSESEWQYFELDKITEVLDHMRVPVNGQDRSTQLGDTPYYGANGLQGFIDGWIFDEPLILIAEDGGYFDEFATRPVAYKIEGKSWVNNHAHILRPNEQFDFDFVFYSLQHKNITPFIKGGTRAKLNQKELREIKLKCPIDKCEQQGISIVLLTIDQAIEKTEALIEKYQQIKAGLMHDLFTRGIGADGKLRPTREEAPELYQQTVIGWIPMDWSIQPISGMAANSKNSTVIGPFGSDLVMSDYKSDGVPVIFVRDVKEDEYNWVSNVFVSNSKAQRLFAHRVNPNDILATKMGLPPCVSCVYPAQAPMGIITADMIRLTADTKKVNANWLSAAINHDRVRRQVSAITAGVTRPKVTLADFRNLKIALPSKNEQEAIYNLLNLQIRRIDDEKKLRAKLKKQKSGLMQDLLTGKVPVKIPATEQSTA